ncbi:hypothetical protein [Coralloluteibacterium stylophorae]|uniref:Uncharacterized protein n=1 Tax=Coralloluteibacterium stylophorae TaxID=1776034 RepID=A0A8J7VR18_9GAMM|nr:hypothetical protein [Coralloluteibacterium stylophorae]MBS7457463.1 hypothetical protein [Coralloluteibacterium stylophorae]
MPAPAIASDADLARHLDGGDSPLRRLSPLAYRRFLDSLACNERGLISISARDIEWELAPKEAAAVWALFGVDRPVESLTWRARPPEWPASGARRALGVPTEIEMRYDRFVAAQTEAAAAGAVAMDASSFDALFGRWFASARYAEVSDRDLTVLLHAALDRADVIRDGRNGTLLGGVLAEMDGRGLAGDRDWFEAADALFVAGEMPAAV